MYRKLFMDVKETTEPFNTEVADGFAVNQLKLSAQYVDHVIDCAGQSFPSSFKFEGSDWCNEREEYIEVVKPRYGNGKGTFELAPSFLRLRKYQFSFEGEKLPMRYLYLPYAEKGGLMRLRGPMYTISPVLADIALSPTKNGVFIALTRDLLTFDRLPYAFVCDGRMINSYVVWSAVHSNAERNPKKPVVMSTLVHYLFCKYGVTETFKRYGKCDVIVGKMSDGTHHHLGDDWVVCNSTRATPWMYMRRQYRPTDAYLAIPKSMVNDHMVTLLTCGFFYVVDHYPERFNPAYVDTDRFWRILMGFVIYRNSTNEGKLASDVDAHMASLDKYIDAIVRESLRKANILVGDEYDAYDFFAYIISEISDIVMNADLATMYGKQLFILRYVMMKIRSQIFLMTYKLNGNSKRQLTKKDVIKIMGQFITRELIFDLTRDHGEVNIIQSPSSCMMLKHTNNIVLQADATGKSRRNKGNTNDISRILSASMIEVGSILNLPKKEPTGKSCISPYVLTDPDGKILRDPEKFDIIERIAFIIKR